MVGQDHQGVREHRFGEGGQGRHAAHRAEEPDAGPEAAGRALVLLPYEEGKRTNLDQWVKNQWVCQPDGTVSTVGADIATKKQFGSFKTHVEFRVPFMPADRGQGRGNSGVFLHARYEIQILDSFGLPVTPVDCASIFGQRAPDLDACLPPGQWQTYDIDFRARSSTPSASRPRGR